MKKVILAAVFAVASLALFSFRTVESNTNDVEVTDVKEFSVAAKNFVESAETFPDKFTRWRREWTDYDTIAKLNMSLDEVNATLAQF